MSGFPEDESAWLIEMDGPLYWSGRDGCRAWWSVADAVRFCRWDDADRLRRLMGFEKARVREHVWPRTVMPAVVRPVPSVEPEPPPAPAQAGWTEVAAESIVKMLRPHDGESRHRLNVEEVLDILRARAPKVRVKLPERVAGATSRDEFHGGGISEYDDALDSPNKAYDLGRRDGSNATWNFIIDKCAAALRSAGVLIEGEQ